MIIMYIKGFDLTPAYTNPAGCRVVKMGKTVSVFAFSFSWVDVRKCEIESSYCIASNKCPPYLEKTPPSNKRPPFFSYYFINAPFE